MYDLRVLLLQTRGKGSKHKKRSGESLSDSSGSVIRQVTNRGTAKHGFGLSKTSFHFTGHCLTHPIVATAATELQAEKAANETFFFKHYKLLTTVLPKYVDGKSIIQKLH